jgi:DNA polymerase III delta subunit
MITIIHGDDTSASRKFFLEQKQKYQDAVTTDGKTLTLEQLKQVFEGGSLFADDKALFIENFFPGKKAGKEFDEILSYIKNLSAGDVYIWEGKELTKSQTIFTKNAVVKQFSFPKQLFSFVESIRPNNSQLVIAFHKALEQSEAELLFFMLIRQFRLLLAFKETPAIIDEVKRTAPWQQTKIAKQASYFSMEQLINAYKKLFKIDVATKTGQTMLSLTKSIDIFLLEL